MTKTEAERIDEEARKYATSEEYPNSVWLKQGFKAGVAWARENPLPHPDIQMLEWLYEKNQGLERNYDGSSWWVYPKQCEQDEFYKTPRDAIRAAMKEKR